MLVLNSIIVFGVYFTIKAVTKTVHLNENAGETLCIHFRNPKDINMLK